MLFAPFNNVKPAVHAAHAMDPVLVKTVLNLLNAKKITHLIQKEIAAAVDCVLRKIAAKYQFDDNTKSPWHSVHSEFRDFLCWFRAVYKRIFNWKIL